MFLLAYRSAKHEIADVTPMKLHFTWERDSSEIIYRKSSGVLGVKHSAEDYIGDLKKKLEKIHCGVKDGN